MTFDAVWACASTITHLRLRVEDESFCGATKRGKLWWDSASHEPDMDALRRSVDGHASRDRYCRTCARRALEHLEVALRAG